MKRVFLVVSLAACALAFAGARAEAAVTSFDERGTILVDGVKTFPISLRMTPPLDGTTPWGTSALDEVVGAGVNLLGTGPIGRDWTDADVAAAEAWNAAAAARGVHTWVHLRELARALPDSPQEERLRSVLATLGDDPGLAMWKGVDEPWWSRYHVNELGHSYSLLKAIDPAHLSVVIQAPRGTPADIAPYAAVTDVHGVNVYPVKFRIPNPKLHRVGVWTQRVRSVTPNGVVMTTLGTCFSGSRDPAGTGAYMLPTREQLRYMAYDAILNGARALNFFGGHNTFCFEPDDAALGWNWTHWNEALKPVVREIGARSRIYPALVSPGTGPRLRASDPTTQVEARLVGRTLWVIAARRGHGEARVRISGLPTSATRRGWVYREGRRIAARRGVLTDTFGRWSVHVYRFVV